MLSLQTHFPQSMPLIEATTQVVTIHCLAIDLLHCALQSAKLKVQKYSGVRSDPNSIGPPQQAAGPSGPNGNPNGPHGPAGTAYNLPL